MRERQLTVVIHRYSLIRNKGKDLMSNSLTVVAYAILLALRSTGSRWQIQSQTEQVARPLLNIETMNIPAEHE